MRLLLPLAATLAVLLVACGGGDETEPAEPAETAAPASPSPAASMTAEERTEAEALLKTAALQLEDLPSGFTLDEERFTTNEEAAEEQTDNPYAPTLDDLNRFGRILGYEANYSQDVSTSGTLSLQVTTTVYQDSDGADEAFEFVREQASDPGFAEEFQQNLASNSGVEVKNATISPMSFAEVGDDRLAFEIEITAHSADLDQDFDFIAQIVGVRRDRAIGALTLVTLGSAADVDELEGLARTLDERMKDALE